MSRRIAVLWDDRNVGTIPVPDSIRPPLTAAELAMFPAQLLIRSRSWLFEVRPGDFRLELRGDEIVAVARPGIGPGDIGCIVGFEPAVGCEDFVDVSMVAFADEVLGDHSKEARQP